MGTLDSAYPDGLKKEEKKPRSKRHEKKPDDGSDTAKADEPRRRGEGGRQCAQEIGEACEASSWSATPTS